MTEESQRMQRLIEEDAQRLSASPEMQDFMNSWGNSLEFREALSALNEHGVKGLDPFIARYRRTALASAQEGDMTELSELVRKGTKLNAGESEFVADWLIGAVPKKRGAPPKFDLSRRVTLAHFWLIEVDGIKGEAALSDLQRLFDIGRSTVSEHLRSGRKCVITQERIAGYRLLGKAGMSDVINRFKGIDLQSG